MDAEQFNNQYSNRVVILIGEDVYSLNPDTDIEQTVVSLYWLLKKREKTEDQNFDGGGK